MGVGRVRLVIVIVAASLSGLESGKILYRKLGAELKKLLLPFGFIYGF